MKLKEARAFIEAIHEAVEAEYKRQVSRAIKQGIAYKKQRAKSKQS